MSRRDGDFKTVIQGALAGFGCPPIEKKVAVSPYESIFANQSPAEDVTAKSTSTRIYSQQFLQTHGTKLKLTATWTAPSDDPYGKETEMMSFEGKIEDKLFTIYAEDLDGTLTLSCGVNGQEVPIFHVAGSIYRITLAPNISFALYVDNLYEGSEPAEVIITNELVEA